MSAVFPVVLCGGAGVRLWPASRPKHAKQFLPLISDLSLFQLSVRRVVGLAGCRRIIVVAGAAHANLVRAQLNAINVDADVLLEPTGRNSAPAVAAAAVHITNLDPEGVGVFVAADHYIPDKDAFGRDVNTAVETARSGGVVTLGIKPAAASTAYGYISAVDSTKKVSAVAQFVEKPDTERALEFLRKGYLWNSGNFIAKGSFMIGEFRQYASEVLGVAEQALEQAKKRHDGLHLGTVFNTAPDISLDYAVMEKTKQAYVVASPMEWSDLGAWDAVHAVLPQDDANNATVGDVLCLDGTGNLVMNRSQSLVVVSGLDDISLIAEDDAIYVNALSKAQNTKSVYKHLKAVGRAEVDIPKRDFGVQQAADWLRSWAFTAAFPVWWSVGFDHDVGIWRENLTMEATGTGDDCRARVQPRQTFAYAAAYNLGWEGPAKQAVAAGFGSIDAHFANENDLLRHVCSASGAAIDERTFAYDQAFFLLALAEASRLVPGGQERAISVLGRLNLGDGRGQAVCEIEQPVHRSNPNMHLFEACLTWVERAGEQAHPIWRQTADDLARLAMGKLRDRQSGFVHEFYDDGWNPLNTGPEGYIEPGHQFEWAWLLTRYSEITGSSAALDHAVELFELGLSGVEPASGFVVSNIDNSGKLVSSQGRFWHQIEWLKACLILGDFVPKRRVEFFSHAETAFAGVSAYLDHPVRGLWFDKMENRRVSRGPSPASTFYHLVSLLQQLEKTARATA
jgi:mannose-1-phosphate guanylyltransferase/mannose-6-phosphate isomerase